MKIALRKMKNKISAMWLSKSYLELMEVGLAFPVSI
jgi:hypothetical protein